MLDLVIEFRLGPDYVETLNELRHHFGGVVSVLGGHHTDKQHDSFYQSRVVEVEVDNQTLEDVLVLHNKFLAELLEQLSVPLYDGFLFVTTILLHIIVFFLKPLENVLKFVFVGENHDDCLEEPAVNILNQLLASLVIDLPGVLQSQNSRDDVGELLLVHDF